MKRRLLTFVLLLLAGAIINVAVAWGCAYPIGTSNVCTECGTPQRFTSLTPAP